MLLNSYYAPLLNNTTIKVKFYIVHHVLLGFLGNKLASKDVKVHLLYPLYRAEYKFHFTAKYLFLT